MIPSNGQFRPRHRTPGFHDAVFLSTDPLDLAVALLGIAHIFYTGVIQMGKPVAGEESHRGLVDLDLPTERLQRGELGGSFACCRTL